jgi:hypothetical protein
LTYVAIATAGTVALALPALAQPLPTQQFPYKSGPVTLASCTLNEPAGLPRADRDFRRRPRGEPEL